MYFYPINTTAGTLNYEKRHGNGKMDPSFKTHLVVPLCFRLTKNSSDFQIPLYFFLFRLNIYENSLSWSFMLLAKKKTSIYFYYLSLTLIAKTMSIIYAPYRFYFLQIFMKNIHQLSFVLPTANGTSPNFHSILYKYWLLMREMVKTISPRCSGDRYYFPAGRRPKGK